MFLCSCGENVAKNYFSPPFIQPRYYMYHPSTTSPRHTNVFCRLSWKNFACCVLVQSRPNTTANQQRIVIWHTRGVGMRLVMNCPATRQDIGPFENLAVLTKFALVQLVVRTCFCDCLTKCIARATQTNQKTTASLFTGIVGQVLGLKKCIRACFL